MSKTEFSPYQNKIWDAILGANDRGLTTFQQEILVRDLSGSRFNLTPALMESRGSFAPFDYNEFIRLNAEDDGVQVFYFTDACTKVFGADTGTWCSWALFRLYDTAGSRRVPADREASFCPKMRLPDAVIRQLKAQGFTRHRWVTRLLSLEMITYFLAVQNRAFSGDPVNATRVNAFREILRNKIGLSDVEDLALRPEILDIPSDPITDTSDTSQPIVQSAPVQSVSTSASPPTGNTGRIRYGNAIDMSVVPFIVPHRFQQPVESEDLASLDASLERFGSDYPVPDAVQSGAAQFPVESNGTSLQLQKELESINVAMQLLEQRRNLLKEKYHQEAALRVIPLGGKINPDTGEWTTVQLKYPDGRVREYILQDSDTDRILS